MDTIGITLVLLTAVVVSAPISRALPIPLPLVQIALGALIAAVTGTRAELRPDIFFLLFLPPLLFLDGWRIQKDGLFRDADTILGLALGLVVFTVIGVGLFIHALIPAMPLAGAFALAAILSPTDPIAVSAITARVPVPKRMMHILEGESLLNDASGLVCMRFAVAAVLTGGFSLVDASLTFLWVAIGGLAIGVAVTASVTWLKGRITRSLGEAGAQILLSLLIPFAAYLMAEQLHCSGILAAVAAGITMSYAEIAGQTLAVTRVRRNAVWDTVQFTANGMIFVLLGEQLPSIAAGAVEIVRTTGHHEPAWLIVYVLAINLALAALRFLWTWASLHFFLFREARRGNAMRRPSWRLIAAMALAGVRGTITLAGILTLPLLMPDGSPFPARDLSIFLAAGVIIMSLVAASLGLPALLRGLQLPPDTAEQDREDRVRSAAAKAAIRAVEQAQHAMAEGRADADLYADAASRIMEVYRRRIDNHAGDHADVSRQTGEIEHRLRLIALKAERDEIVRNARANWIDDASARSLIREVDLLEARYAR